MRVIKFALIALFTAVAAIVVGLVVFLWSLFSRRPRIVRTRSAQPPRRPPPPAGAGEVIDVTATEVREPTTLVH